MDDLRANRSYYLTTMNFSQRPFRYGPAARSQPGPSGVCEQASSPVALLRHWNQGAGLAAAVAMAAASENAAMRAKTVIVARAYRLRPVRSTRFVLRFPR